MKTIVSILAFCCIFKTIDAQSIIINKQLKDFPDTYDLSTPLNAGITCSYLIVNGKENLWRDASVYMIKEYFPKGRVADRVVSEENKTRMLNGTIEEVIIYKDSFACMITKLDSAYYSIRWLGFEDGKWLNNGEDGRHSLEESRNLFNTYASKNLAKLHQSNVVKSVSTDTLAFVNYIKQYGSEPKHFLLETLAKYPLVIYGEIHRRKVSWDFLSSVLSDSRFPERVGTVFLELPAYQQPEFDRFYASKELDTEILLDIMRSEQIYGWWDRGEYEFLLNVWKLNQTLPADRQIRVIATDEQPPYKLFKTEEDFEKWRENSYNRNTRMADVIEQTVKTKMDNRNCLFVVGYMHAYKSHVPVAEGENPVLSAGAQLVQRLSAENVFNIFQHVPMGTNWGALGLIRQGLFDVAFEKTGNKPVAFNLSDSPFGTEPFDADYGMSFDSRVGNFADNFDGYIFFQPLKDEDSDYVLYGIWNDQFVEEIKRRAALDHWDVNRWLDIEGELTKEKIINVFKEKEGKKRWRYLFE